MKPGVGCRRELDIDGNFYLAVTKVKLANREKLAISTTSGSSCALDFFLLVRLNIISLSPPLASSLSSLSLALYIPRPVIMTTGVAMFVFRFFITPPLAPEHVTRVQRARNAIRFPLRARPGQTGCSLLEHAGQQHGALFYSLNVVYDDHFNWGKR